MKLKLISRSTGAALATAACLLLLGIPAGAVFDAAVSPPRYELRGKPGETLRQVLHISNGSALPARYAVKTADWQLGAYGAVGYLEGPPQAGSCRPWVRLERREISVEPRGTRAFRFEVHIPKDAKAGECLFAFLVSSQAGMTVKPDAKNLSVPIVGRVGVVAYLAIGDAKPDLRLAEAGFKKIEGKTVPTVTFYNQGTAHGRVFGVLEGKDAAGRQVELIVEDGAVLPKARRSLRLMPVDYSSGEGRAPKFELTPPMHVRGKLEPRGSDPIKFDQVIR